MRRDDKKQTAPSAGKRAAWKGSGIFAKAALWVDQRAEMERDMTPEERQVYTSKIIKYAKMTAGNLEAKQALYDECWKRYLERNPDNRDGAKADQAAAQIETNAAVAADVSGYTP